MPVEERPTQKAKSVRPTKTAKGVRKVKKSRRTSKRFSVVLDDS